MVATYIQGPDPNWSYQRNDRITNALNTLLSMKERRAKEREKQFMLALKAMEMNPQSSLTPMADDLMAQYGDQPGAYAMIQAVRSRAEQMNQVQENLKEFVGKKEQEELEDAVWRENYLERIRKDPAFMRDAMGQERPDMVGPPSPQDVATDRFQNTLGFSLEAQSRPSPGYRAISSMTPDAQLGAIAGMKPYGMTPPVAPSAFGGFEIPKEIQALAMAAGPQAAYDAWMRQNGAMPSANVEAQMAYNQEALAARQQAAADKTQAQIEMIGIRQSNAESLARLRDELGEGKQTVSGAINATMKDMKEQQKVALAEANAIKDAKAKREALAQIPEVPPVSLASAAAKALKAAGTDPDMAGMAFQEMWEKALTTTGNDPKKAAALISEYLKAKGLR